MQTTQRQHEAGLIPDLSVQPHRYRFVQAVRLLTRWLRQHGVPPEEAFRRVLRFENSLELRFPASEIEGIRIDQAQSAPGLPHWEDKPLGRIRVTPAFTGLLGVNGALPLHHTETIAALPAAKRESARAFVDLFSSRMAALHFQAWGKHRVEHKLDVHGRDELQPMLHALAGLAPGDSDAGLFPARLPAACYAALLRMRPVSASAIARVLSEYFAVPVTVEEFVGSWDPIPPAKRSTLGTAAPRLGHGMVLGSRHWRHDMRVRLNIGPLNESELARMLPGGPTVKAVEEVLRLFPVACMQYEARILLAPSAVRPMVIRAERGMFAQRLGWNTFLTSRAGAAARPEVRFMLRTSRAKQTYEPPTYRSHA